MQRKPIQPVLVALILLLLVHPSAEGQSAGRGFGVLVGAAASASPLSETAERNGTYAVPGLEYELRLLLAPRPGREWSVGVLTDSYQLDQTLDIASRSRFDYRSTSIVASYSLTEPVSGVPVVYGVDLGWTGFRATSSGPNYYSGDPEDTRTRGDAVVLGLSYGVEIPLHSVSLIPRLRVTTNYPDFGGGDGYSGLHRERDLGFKASFGVNVKARFPLGPK